MNSILGRFRPQVWKTKTNAWDHLFVAEPPAWATNILGSCPWKNIGEMEAGLKEWLGAHYDCRAFILDPSPTPGILARFRYEDRTVFLSKEIYDDLHEWFDKGGAKRGLAAFQIVVHETLHGMSLAKEGLEQFVIGDPGANYDMALEEGLVETLSRLLVKKWCLAYATSHPELHAETVARLDASGVYVKEVDLIQQLCFTEENDHKGNIHPLRALWLADSTENRSNLADNLAENVCHRLAKADGLSSEEAEDIWMSLPHFSGTWKMFYPKETEPPAALNSTSPYTEALRDTRSTEHTLPMADRNELEMAHRRLIGYPQDNGRRQPKRGR